MADPGDLRDELDEVLVAAAGEARAFLATIECEPVKPAGAEAAPSSCAPSPGRHHELNRALGEALLEDGAKP